jgi:hypothetical protein
MDVAAGIITGGGQNALPPSDTAVGDVIARLWRADGD